MADTSRSVDILEAVAAFLVEDARKAIADPDVGFRVLIASSLCKIAAAEVRHADRLEGIARLEGQLVDRIRQDDASDDPEIRHQVMAALIDRLAIVNPKFDTRSDIP